MEDMIQKRLQIINDLTAEFNSLKENYDDMLEDDPLYQEVQEKELEVREEKKASRTRLMTNSTYYEMSEEIKEKRREIKENNEILSQELVELYRKEGKLEIIDTEGNVKRMKFSVRLVNG
jgi:hypothetical protein